MLVAPPVVDVKTDTFGSTAVLKKMVNVFHGMTVITRLRRHQQLQLRQPLRLPLLLRQQLQLRRRRLSHCVQNKIKFGTAVRMLHVWQHVKTQFRLVVVMIISALSNVFVKWEP